MSRRFLSRLFAAAMALVALVGSAACEPRAGQGARSSARPSPRGPLPSSMAALGDSITTAFGSCVLVAACKGDSWSTGDGPRVNSHFQRIKESNFAIRGHAYNFAVPGARAQDLTAQAKRAVERRVEYVTVLIGVNDICHAGVDAMTSVRDFRSRVDRALGTLKRGLPNAKVLVVSIPNLYRLWEIGHSNARAVRSWSTGVCPALLANPTSQDSADRDRRAMVRARVTAFNRQLASACRAYGRHCRYDGGAAYAVRFTVDMLSRLDYFHPGQRGQNKLAKVTFPRSFAW